MTMSPIGHRVRSLREARGLSQKELALHAKVPRGWLSILELGEIESPGARRMQMLATALGTSPAYLLSGAQEPEETELRVPTDRAGYLERLSRFAAWQLQRLEAMAGLAFSEPDAPISPEPQDMRQGVDREGLAGDEADTEGRSTAQ